MEHFPNESSSTALQVTPRHLLRQDQPEQEEDPLAAEHKGLLKGLDRCASLVNLQIQMASKPFYIDQLRKLDMELLPAGIKFSDIKRGDERSIDSPLFKLGVSTEEFSELTGPQLQNNGSKTP